MSINDVCRYSSKRLDTTANHVFQADVDKFALMEDGKWKSMEKLLFWKCNYSEDSDDWEVMFSCSHILKLNFNVQVTQKGQMVAIFGENGHFDVKESRRETERFDKINRPYIIIDNWL